VSILAIDAGNTRIKWGLHDGTRWVQQGAFATAETERFEEALVLIGVPDSAIVANVAGERVAQILSGILRSRGIEPFWAQSRAEQCGVRSSYADPGQLGVDRWAALIGARHLYPGACVVVNVGTTMTVDALSSDSIFLGGFIVCGYTIMREALARRTAQLELYQGAFSFFPDNTADAIASGALNALAGAVDRMCRYMIETGEDEPLIVLSGGNAALLQPRLQSAPELVENLVLEGLVRMGTENG
jgi:type III pantothenate kinase